MEGAGFHPPATHRVVVIGGGFGGLFATRVLRRAPVEVTLLDRTNHHLFQPLLYQVATGVLSEGQMAPPNKIDRYVSDLIGILDALGVETVRLVGHDWGAAVGWQTCIQHPERIDRYAAIAVGHPSAYAHGGVVQKLKAYYILFFQIPGLSEKAVSSANWWLWRQMLRYVPELPAWKRDLSGLLVVWW